MVWPILAAGLGALGLGAYIGAQVDDALEKPPSNQLPSANPVNDLLSYNNLIKFALLTGTSYYAYKLLKQTKFIK